MPELPEVEIVKQGLEKLIKSNKILSVDVNSIKSLKNIDLINFKSKLINQSIIDIKRIAKYLIFILNDYYLIFHLRMEGKFNFFKNQIESKNLNHNILVLEFTNNEILEFNDFRKFATIHLFEKNENLTALEIFNKIGPEPWKINSEEMFNKLNKSSTKIKTILLSQKIISGLGNIYVDEVLFECKIMPTRLSNEVTKKEVNCIIEKSKEIFEKSIKHGGTTIKTFNALDQHGNFQQFLKVHTKKGEKCMSKYFVKKIKVNGRGTYYCENYQK